MTSITQNDTINTDTTSDADVFQKFRQGLHQCLVLDREMAAHCGTARADNAMEALDREIDAVFEAYADMVSRGMIGLFEDTLIERGMTGAAQPDGGAA